MSVTTDDKKAAQLAPGEDQGGGGPLPERVTVNLSVQSVLALDAITSLTGVTKTDAINKALQLYAEIRRIISDGGAVYIREPGESDLERVKIF